MSLTLITRHLIEFKWLLVNVYLKFHKTIKVIVQLILFINFKNYFQIFLVFKAALKASSGFSRGYISVINKSGEKVDLAII